MPVRCGEHKNKRWSNRVGGRGRRPLNKLKQRIMHWSAPSVRTQKSHVTFMLSQNLCLSQTSCLSLLHALLWTHASHSMVIMSHKFSMTHNCWLRLITSCIELMNQNQHIQSKHIMQSLEFPCIKGTQTSEAKQLNLPVHIFTCLRASSSLTSLSPTDTFLSGALVTVVWAVQIC
jgi:hypothetical protein